MDVTNEILKNHLIYGASDYTASYRHAAGRSLNYADGPSITRPAYQSVSIIPYVLKYESSVGLFGAENYFVKVTLDIQNNARGVCYEEPFWECAYVDYSSSISEPYYDAAIVDKNDFSYTDSYVQAFVTDNALPSLVGKDAFVSVDLNNLKVGNIYIDDWLDVRLYTKDREEHPFDKMYVRYNDFFYIGIHARNTKRLQFNVECVVGEEFLEYAAIQEKQLIMRSTAYGSYGAYDAYEGRPMRVKQGSQRVAPASGYQ